MLQVNSRSSTFLYVLHESVDRVYYSILCIGCFVRVERHTDMLLQYIIVRFHAYFLFPGIFHVSETSRIDMTYFFISSVDFSAQEGYEKSVPSSHLSK